MAFMASMAAITSLITVYGVYTQQFTLFEFLILTFTMIICGTLLEIYRIIKRNAII